MKLLSKFCQQQGISCGNIHSAPIVYMDRKLLLRADQKQGIGQKFKPKDIIQITLDRKCLQRNFHTSHRVMVIFKPVAIYMGVIRKHSDLCGTLQQMIVKKYVTGIAPVCTHPKRMFFK